MSHTVTVKLYIPMPLKFFFDQIWLFIAESKKPLQYIWKVAMETEILSHDSFSYIPSKDCDLPKRMVK